MFKDERRVFSAAFVPVVPISPYILSSLNDFIFGKSLTRAGVTTEEIMIGSIPQTTDVYLFLYYPYMSVVWGIHATQRHKNTDSYYAVEFQRVRLFDLI